MIGSGRREIDDGGLRLREVRQGDAELLHRWRMEDGTRAMFLNTAPVPFEAHQAWFRRYFEPGNTDRWFIAELEGVPVGTMALHGLDASGTEYEWGRLIVPPEHRGQGVAMRIMRALMAYARAEGIRKLRSEVLETNARVIASQHELGLKVEGVREHEGRRFVRFVTDL